MDIKEITAIALPVVFGLIMAWVAYCLGRWKERRVIQTLENTQDGDAGITLPDERLDGVVVEPGEEDHKLGFFFSFKFAVGRRLPDPEMVAGVKKATEGYIFNGFNSHVRLHDTSPKTTAEAFREWGEARGWMPPPPPPPTDCGSKVDELKEDNRKPRTKTPTPSSGAIRRDSGG